MQLTVIPLAFPDNRAFADVFFWPLVEETREQVRHCTMTATLLGMHTACTRYVLHTH